MSSRMLLLVAVVLAAVAAGAIYRGARAQEPQPRPEKVDALLFGALGTQGQTTQAAPNQAGGEYELAYIPQSATRVPGRLFTSADGRAFIDALIKTDGSLDGIEDLGVVIQSVVGTVAAARVPIDSLGRLTSLPNVEFIQTSRPHTPTNDVSVPATGAPAFHDQGIDGSGVIMGVIDTGVDYAHADFRNPDGMTRIKFICDQTDPPQAGDATCPGNGLPNGGTLWTEAQINAAFQGAGTVRQVDPIGHGSHVLGSAAGDDPTYGGMAPGADIIMVKTTFFDVDIVNALSFIDERAAALDMPYVVNMSLGGHFGPHDGTDLLSQAIDDLSGAGKPGKAIVVAAGNDGSAGIHASGDLKQGIQQPYVYIWPGSTYETIDIWYDGGDSFAVGLTDPTGSTFGYCCVSPGQSYPSDPNLFWCWFSRDTCFRIDHSLPQAGNGDIEVTIQIIPDSNAQQIGLSGWWRLSLNGSTVNDGRFDAWCTNVCDFYTPHLDNAKTIGEPGVAQNAITVGSYATKDCWSSEIGTQCYTTLPTVGGISSFSSIGPTRDGRMKPDIAAPGQAIVSTKSAQATFTPRFTAPDGIHASAQGTSMAAPHVAGAVALLLAEDPGLDAAQIKAKLQAMALKDAFTGVACNNTWGCGKLHVVPAGVCGDLNGDGVVSIVDVAIDLQIAVGLVAPTAEQMALGDVTAYGQLNVEDAEMILQKVVAMVASLSCEPQ